MSDSTSQPDILPRLSAGEPDAAQQCLERYGAVIWSLARRHMRSPAEAEDAVQEIFIAIWKNAGRFDPAKASELTFITMIARRRLIDLHRKKERRPQTIDSEMELEVLPDLRSQEAENRAEAYLAGRALKKLQPKEREAVLRSVCHGMTHGEISRYMGLPLGTVKTYVRRGLMRVREALGNVAARPEEASP